MATFNSSQFRSQLRQAQRKAEREIQREVDRVNREIKREVDQHNRKAEAHNRKVVADHNKGVDQYNRRAEQHNRGVVRALNNRLRAGSIAGPGYTPSEQILADRVHEAIIFDDGREYDLFLSYARIDGAEVAASLREHLQALGTSVWHDEVAIVPGHSQSRQMDSGLQKARAGIALLTPAYLAGRFWTERELGALLGKSTLIPVLHNVSFDDVKEYSGILPDLAGFETKRDDVSVIAEKIAAAVLAWGPE